MHHWLFLFASTDFFQVSSWLLVDCWRDSEQRKSFDQIWKCKVAPFDVPHRYLWLFPGINLAVGGLLRWFRVWKIVWLLLEVQSCTTLGCSPLLSLTVSKYQIGCWSVAEAIQSMENRLTRSGSRKMHYWLFLIVITDFFQVSAWLLEDCWGYWKYGKAFDQFWKCKDAPLVVPHCYYWLCPSINLAVGGLLRLLRVWKSICPVLEEQRCTIGCSSLLSLTLSKYQLGCWWIAKVIESMENRLTSSGRAKMHHCLLLFPITDFFQVSTWLLVDCWVYWAYGKSFVLFWKCKDAPLVVLLCYHCLCPSIHLAVGGLLRLLRVWKIVWPVLEEQRCTIVCCSFLSLTLTKYHHDWWWMIAEVLEGIENRLSSSGSAKMHHWLFFFAITDFVQVSTWLLVDC